MTPVQHIEAKDLDRTIASNIRMPQRLIRVLDPLLRRAEAGRAVHITDPDAALQTYQTTYAVSKMAGAEIFRRWGEEAAQTSALRVIAAAVPPMPTAVRARFRPGEDRDSLTPTTDVASRLVDAIASGGQGQIDLR